MGALTNKKEAFSYRKWEFRNVGNTFDRTDCLLPKIQIQENSNKIVRILPLEEWISNRIRFYPIKKEEERRNLINEEVSFKYNKNYIIKKNYLYGFSFSFFKKYFFFEIISLKNKLRELNFNWIISSNQFHGTEISKLREKIQSFENVRILHEGDQLINNTNIIGPFPFTLDEIKHVNFFNKFQLICISANVNKFSSLPLQSFKKM
jgi:hypothetical protein